MPSFSTPYHGIGSYLPPGYQETLNLPGAYLNRAITGAADSIALGLEKYALAKRENDELDARGAALIEQLQTTPSGVMKPEEAERVSKWVSNFPSMNRRQKLEAIFGAQLLSQDVAPRVEAYANSQGFGAGQGHSVTTPGASMIMRGATGQIDADKFAALSRQGGQDASIDAWNALSPHSPAAANTGASDAQIKYIAYQKQRALAQLAQQAQDPAAPHTTPDLAGYATPSGNIPNIAALGAYTPSTNIPVATPVGDQVRLPNQAPVAASIAPSLFFAPAPAPQTFGALAQSANTPPAAQPAPATQPPVAPTMDVYADQSVKLPDSQAYVAPDLAKAMESYVKAGGKSPQAFMQTFGQYAKLEADARPGELRERNFGGVKVVENSKTGDFKVIPMEKVEKGSKLTDSAVDKLIKIAGIKDQVTNIEELRKSVKGGAIMGILTGSNPWDVKARLLQAEITASAPGLARAMGEVGVLTDKDIERYSALLPNIRTPDAAVTALSDILKTRIDRMLNVTLDTYRDAGYDVDRIAQRMQTEQSSAPTPTGAPVSKTTFGVPIIVKKSK